MNATTDTPMKAARLEKGWTLQQLSEMMRTLGVVASGGRLSRIERDISWATPEESAALTSLLGVQLGRSKMFRARLDKGYTLRSLSRALKARGVSVSDGNLSRMERGLTAPSPVLRAAIAQLLDIAEEDLPPSKVLYPRT